MLHIFCPLAHGTVVNTDLGATNKYYQVDKLTNNENPEALTPQIIKIDYRLNTRKGS